jgi:hypothetical protein
MDFGYVFMFLGISILSSLNCKNSAIGMIKRIGINLNSRHYPRGYTNPAKWVRALFKIKQRVIPRYLYFQLILSLIFALMGPINLIICITTGCDPDIVGILVMLHCCLVLIDTIYFSIQSFRLKR